MITVDARLRRAALAVAPLGLVIPIAALMLPLSPAYDLNVFLHAGRAVLSGRGFYPRVGSAAVYSGSSFVYPAITVWPFVALAAIPEDLAKAIFFALCACAVVAAARIAAPRDRWIAVLVLCTAFTITGLQLGALSPLLFVGAVFMWELRDRPVVFGLLAAPVIVSKLFLAPLLLWPLLARRYRAFGWATALTFLMLAAGFVFGPLTGSSYVRLLSELGNHEAGAGFGVIGLLRHAGLTALEAQAGALAIGAFVIAQVYVHYRRVGDERVLYCAGIVCALLLTPVLWSHYLVLLLAVLLAIDARRRWFAVVAIASWVMSPPHGLHLTLPVPAALKSPGPWFAVALLPLLLALATRSRGRDIDAPGVHREKKM